jgi:hypothetical protein
MKLSEDQIAKIILIRSIEESDAQAFSEVALAEESLATGQIHVGVDWLERRAALLFDKLSNRHQSIVQLAQAPAPWTMPVCVIALLAGLATNLLGPAERIHVIRNPVFLLIAWNLLVYNALVVALLLTKKKIVPSARPVARESEVRDESEALRDPSLLQSAQAPWLARALLPGVWQFFHRLVFGLHEKKTFAAIVRRFSVNWIRVAGSLVTARWKFMLHLGALCMAIGAIGGMYFRGLLQDYWVSWASTFITSEESVRQFIAIVFAPSLFVTDLLGFRLEDQISVARLFSPQGDQAEPWIHLFAVTVLWTIVFPRALLALWQWKKTHRLKSTLALALDDYYGDMIETPVRSLIANEVEIGAVKLSENIAGFVSAKLYDEQVVPKLRRFRENGGKIAALKADLEQVGNAFLPRLNTYIVESGMPEFQSALAQRVGAILKNLESDFVKVQNRQPVFDGFNLTVASPLDEGVADPLNAVVGVSVAAPIALTIATLGGGLGHHLGIAIISTLLGTTGPVGFMIGLIGGALVAGAAWWFGKETINEAITNIDLPAAVVRTALWQSRFEQLVEHGRQQCEESVRGEVLSRLKPLQPAIADEILSRVRKIWSAADELSVV